MESKGTEQCSQNATIKPSPEPFEPDPELGYPSKYYIPF
jgi:hypothetical protein